MKTDVLPTEFLSVNQLRWLAFCLREAKDTVRVHKAILACSKEKLQIVQEAFDKANTA